MMTIQDDIFADENRNALFSFTNMKLPAPTAALGWLQCHWLLLLLLTALNTKHTSEHQKCLLATSKHLRRQALFQASPLPGNYAASSGTSLPAFRPNLSVTSSLGFS
jgi:hypothetical protein